MRRGLISWSRAELPEAALDARVARLQGALAAARIDALVVYTIPARTAGVSWLTGFVPYWNEGLVVLPAAGRPVLVSALSNRVKDWIERNAHVERVISNPKIGLEAATLVAALKPGAKVAVVDLPRLPAGLIDALAAGGLTVSDGTALLASVRTAADPSEIALAIRAGEIARAAFEHGAASGETRDAGALIGRIEGEARRLGAEEVYPAVAVDLARRQTLARLEGAARLGERFAIRLSVAYKGVWVRLARTFGATPDPETRAELMFADAVARLPDLRPIADHATSWLIEHTPAATPLEPLAGSMLPDGKLPAPGSLVNVQVTFAIDGLPHLIGAPVLIGKAGEAAAPLLAVPGLAATAKPRADEASRSQ